MSGTGPGPPRPALLAAFRDAAGLTQEQAAARAGLSVRGLSNLERGLVARPRRSSLEALATALGLTERDRRRLIDSYRAAPDGGTAPEWLGPRSPLRELVGRQAELAELGRALREHDLVTVTGPAGCGKTVLALAAAAGSGQPVTVLGLASLAAAEQILPALTTTLQLRVATAAAMPDAVEQALSGRRQLLVVDNAEHLAGPVADLLLRLRGGCPALTVLVTSRVPLGLSEELVWRLLPLQAPTGDTDDRAPAAELFRRRARTALPSADLSDAAAVGRICRGLDGLPLALELAAARVRALPVPELADRLERGDDLLTSAVPGPGGRRTLEQTIDWSYRLLDEDEQRALAQLSVLRGAFGPEVVEAVVSVRGNPVAIAAQLVDRSMLLVETGGRYAMLRTIGGYAARRLAESGELPATRGRHLDHWLERGRRLAAVAGFGDRLEAAHLLSADLTDAEQAMAGGLDLDRGVAVVELAHLLLDCWNVAPGYAAHGERWLATVDGLGDRCPPRLRALARTGRGQLLSLLGDRPGGLAQLQAGLADAAALTADERLDLLGMTAQVENSLLDPAAVARADQLVAATAGGPPGDQLAAALGTAVQIDLDWGRLDRAAAGCDRVAELVRTTSGWLAAGHQAQRAELAAQRGEVVAAREALRQAVAAATGIGPARWSRLRMTVAEVLLALDSPEAAYEHTSVALRAPEAEAPELHRRTQALQVPRAEALRRLGRPGAAAALRAGLEAVRADRLLGVGLAAVLVTAAVGQDAGDATAAELAADWQRVRLALGRPVPVGYRAAARDLGLDLAAGDPLRARPAAAELADLLDRAARTARAVAGS